MNETSGLFYLPVVLEIPNTGLLTFSVYLFYAGIEIKHPVYGVLFFDLLVTLASSVINVAVFPFVKTVRFNNLVNGNSVVCLLFHCGSWCVVSALRYAFIVHHDWMGNCLEGTSTLIQDNSQHLLVI